jgi:diguanylate cyclase
MYEVKSQGKDNVFFFDEDMSIKIQRQLEIEKLLPFALEDREFYLHYQPQMSADGRILGCEALLRWENSAYGFISPDEFIPLSEQSTHIIHLGHYMMEEVLRVLLNGTPKVDT